MNAHDSLANLTEARLLRELDAEREVLARRRQELLGHERDDAAVSLEPPGDGLRVVRAPVAVGDAEADDAARGAVLGD